MSRDIVSFGFVDRVAVEDNRGRVALKITTADQDSASQVVRDVEEALYAIGLEPEVTIELQAPASPGQGAQKAVSRDDKLLPGVKSVVAVASGKGGVGKSTVAANLAVQLAAQGERVGIMDADIFGPSIPTMFGIDDHPKVIGKRVIPFEKYGVKIMSLGFIVESGRAVIWRGPMVMRAIEQLLGDVDWGELDYLIVDLPPGTGDAQLTLVQKVPLAGAVVVTTPQDVALADARRGISMFRSVEVPIIGIVENMSIFCCPNCGHETEVFKKGGGKAVAEEMDAAFLGAIPLDPAIMLGADSGEPIVLTDPEGPHAQAFDKVANAVRRETDALAAQKMPLVIS